MRRFATMVVPFVFACGGASSSPTPAEQPVAQQALTETSKCDGNRVPPSNYKQETAFVSNDTPNAADTASQTATARLRDKICQGYRCSAIESKITVWNTESDSNKTCAMAVIKGSDVAQFLDEPRKSLGRELRLRSDTLVEYAKKKSKKETPTLVVGNVIDNGVEGGARAEWLIDKLASALADAGAETGKLPAGWSGLSLPNKVDGVITGKVTRLHGQESMLEVIWKVDTGASTRAAKGLEFPELIGPVIDPATFLPELPGTDDISINFDSRPGGGMCPGDRGELTIEVGRPLMTRVINLYGDGSEGIVVSADDKKLPANASQKLFDFHVVKATSVPVERFIVFGSETKAGFGEYANIKAPCRLPKDVAKKLSSGTGYPTSGKKFRAVRSYRILEPDVCGPSPNQAQDLSALDQLPACW